MAEKSAAELVEFIAKGIVGSPDAVRVNVQDGGRMLELVTSDEDRGRVIGRQGRVAKAIRSVLERVARGSRRAARHRRLKRDEEAGRGRRVIVGQIAGAHGVGGEVRVRALADAALLLGMKRFALSRSGPDDPQASEVENQGGGTGRAGEVRLSLRGLADRDAAEALRGTLVLADVADLPPLPAGSHYWFELVGCAVETAAGERVGTVTGLLDTGAAHDVLQIAGDDGRARLVPMVAALLRSVDVATQRIVLEDVAGLADPA